MVNWSRNIGEYVNRGQVLPFAHLPHYEQKASLDPKASFADNKRRWFVNNLIIYYSPIKGSFTEKIALRLKEIFETKKEVVVLRDLKDINFNPVISEDEINMSKEGDYLEDVLIEQRMINEADNIFLIYPLYQLAMPAVMKGYIDRVLTQGFSYSYKEDGGVVPHMKGKRISLFSPMAAPMGYALETGNIQAMNHIARNTFEFRGFEIRSVQYFDCNDRDKQLDDLEEKLLS
jgi:NAD(P)H dehydrogenase (quinone)